MKKITLPFLVFTFLLFSVSNIFAQINWSYDWEDGGTALSTYGNVIVSNSTEQAHGGTKSLKMLEDPLDGTPQAYIWWVTGLTDGDEVTASIWVYDLTPDAAPSGRIWGHYTPVGGDIDSYAGSASGNETYSDGLGWSQLEYTWTFDSNVGARDGLVVEARIYSAEGANVIYVDDAAITVSNESAIIHAANGEILPVELTSFTAELFENTVQLYWTTATELNNLGFEIERSFNNEKNFVWEKVGFVDGNGTTSEANTYTFIDDSQKLNGVYSYRLKQMDNDGSFTYSNSVEVEINNIPDKFILKQNYPNPFNPATVIEYSLPVKEFVAIKVYDIIGNEMVSLVNEEKEAGTYEITFDASNLTSGIYFYTMQSGTFRQTNKMILIK